ncbi:hypothetical protein [Arenimonas terrae]|uniref:hypothetical protein n=1 Tax=Arenimonas terrae TaxID=2546226 RepID=UPI00159EBFBA|nr:hypothetical protein [Arenimonas terrae]
MPTPPSPLARRLVGGTLIGASALSLLAMSHHPTAHGMSKELWVADLVRIGALSRPVHGGMIVCVIALWLALAEWTAWRGTALARIAEKLYGLGAIAMIGAALINGFAIDHYASSALQGGPDALRDAARVMPLAWSLNQTLAGFGVFALSGGIVAWSIDLWRGPGVLARVAATYGVVVMLGLCATFAFSAFELDVTGMAAVVLAQAFWYVTTGIVSWRHATFLGKN